MEIENFFSFLIIHFKDRLVGVHYDSGEMSSRFSFIRLSKVKIKGGVH